MSRYYCCDYKDLRFKPDARSAGRVKEIAAFFQYWYQNHMVVDTYYLRVYGRERYFGPLE